MGKKLEREKMPSTGKNNKEAGRDELAYQQERAANLERIKRKLAELNIPTTENNEAQQGRPRKALKKKNNPSITPTEPPILRPRSQRNKSRLVQEQPVQGADLQPDLQPDGDFLSNNEDPHNDIVSNDQKGRKGRGITKKDDIFSRKPGMPKIPILLNDLGQPVGKNARQLSSVIGCQVRKRLSLASMDWRLVDNDEKYALWSDIKEIYDIDDDAYNWFMRTAGKKWKEFKATIKELYFKPGMTMEEVGESLDSRIPDPDWNFLFSHWMSPEFEVRSNIAKANRAKLGLHHTSGSVSYACAEYDLAIELGRPPRRDEKFVKNHTRKNGVPTSQAEPIINQLKDVLEVYPELKDRTIQEGDAFAVVCGTKEPKGYVRGIGLGPTPQDMGTPGLKGYVPTRLQMEILAQKKAQSEKVDLEQHVNDLNARITLLEQRGQQDRIPKNGGAELVGNEKNSDSEESSDEDDQLHCASQSRPAKFKTTPRGTDAPRSEHDALVGKHVILYAMLRSNQPVAKGTVMSTTPSTIIGGQPLGKEFCEVIVTCVLKRDSMLPRPYGNMETLADAHMMAIAWPYKKLKIAINGPTSHVGSDK